MPSFLPPSWENAEPHLGTFADNPTEIARNAPAVRFIPSLSTLIRFLLAYYN